MALVCCLVFPAVGGPIETVGLNLYRDSPEYHAFWKACGYNTLEFLDQGWFFRPDQHASFYAAFASEIEKAQAEGFKVYVLLNSNMAQWTGPEVNGPADYLGRFDPADSQAMTTRLGYLQAAITHLKQADGFVFIAGDPGGNSEAFNTTVAQCMAMARSVRDLVYTHAGPETDFIVNAWAASYWVGTPTSAYTRQLWDEENQGTADIVNAADLIGSLTGAGGRPVGIEFSCDNYYRPLALTCYANAPTPPMELYPQPATITTLAQRGVRQQWGWPYFLVDEADGGYATNGMAQSEVRYIRQYVEQARTLGLNGIIGNLSFAGRAAEALNAYALARFSLPTSASVTQATADDVFREFAGFVASSSTSATLNHVLRYLENTSTWHQSLPAAQRLPAVDDGQTLTAWRALTRLHRVQPNLAPAIALPEPPQEYLKRIQLRLEALAAGESGLPLSPSHDAQSGELIGLQGANWAGDVSTGGGLDGGLSQEEDRAALVVSSNVAATGFASRLDRPVELRRSHAPQWLRIGYRTNGAQTTGGLIYWDDVLLGTIDAQANAEGLATVDLPIPAGMMNHWAYFARGPHLLTIEVPHDPTLTRYFEVDALWLADTPRRYLPGFTWDFALDYADASASPDDAGSVRRPGNEGLSRSAPQQPVWSLGYSTAKPFNPATTAFQPASFALLEAQSQQVVGMGLAHGDPTAAPGASLGQVADSLAPALGCGTMALWAKGIGSKAIPQVGVSVSPVILAFHAPESGWYDVDIRLKGRQAGWYAAASLYKEATRLGARRTSYNGSAMNFTLTRQPLARGERLFLIIEGMSDSSWSEVILNQVRIRLDQLQTSQAQAAWGALD